MSQPARGVSVPRISPADADRFAAIVERHFGLYFPANRRAELERGILHAFAASTCQDLGDFCGLIEAEARSGSGAGLELGRLINALTVGETYFFRDAGQFDALYQTVLPELIERRRTVRTLRLWSAGCASGEEPYSIAMLLRALLPDVDRWAITILGTDVNAEALARAREAVFGDWAFREERARAWRDRFFVRADGTPPGARDAGGTRARWALMPEVGRMVAFRQLNLAGDGYPSVETDTTSMDLVLCRNVTIYFSERAMRRVIEKLHAALAPAGWLVVGHAEPSPANYARFEPRTFPGALLYRRVQHDLSPAHRQPVRSPVPSPPAWPAMQASLPQRGPRRGDQARAPLAEQQVCEAIEQAREMLEYGHSKQACAVLEAALSGGHCAPAYAPAAYTLLGQAHANLGELPTAEQWCRRAIAADRLALEAYYTLALVLQHQGRMPEAIDTMKKVVYIDRHSILGHFGLGNLYRSQGEEAQAQRAMANARRLLEGRPPAEVIPGSGGITVGSLYQAVVKGQGGRHTQ